MKLTSSKKKSVSLKRAWLKRGPQTVEDYIKTKIVKVNAKGCKLWHGATKRRVGFFQFKYVSGGAPRCIYQALVGPAGDQCVLHKCDDSRCVNIKHLYLGDRKQNRKDFMERHPRAMEICKKAVRNAQKGCKEFWSSMSSSDRKKFCLERGRKQAAKHPSGSPARKQAAKNSSITKRRRYPPGHSLYKQMAKTRIEHYPKGHEIWQKASKKSIAMKKKNGTLRKGPYPKGDKRWQVSSRKGWETRRKNKRRGK